MSVPYISFVAASRNDDHGGGLIKRMNLFVNGLVEQCKRHHLEGELVLVEWNPPADRKRLSQAIEWPPESKFCPIRIIEVPHMIHQRFNHADNLPLFQMMAKNVGIRRAHGQFIVATNIDILFSDELMRFLASGRLKDRMYRVNRYDVKADMPVNRPISEQLDWCLKNTVRVNRRKGTTEIRRNTIIRNSFRCRLLHKLKKLFTSRGRQLHTNACGDFTLMSADRWNEVRGYPEFEMFSMYLDGLLCHAAHYAGARETVLADKLRIFHIEHAAGSGWTPGRGGKLMENRIDKEGIPRLGYDQYLKSVNEMKIKRKPIIFNNERWGMVDEALNEWIIQEQQD